MTKLTKFLCILCLLILCLALFTGCEAATHTGNRVVGGSDVQTFHYAYVYLGGQKIAAGYVEQWRDYDNSEAVQVKIDGKYYLTEYTNVVLVSDPSLGWTGYSDVDFWYGVSE